MAGKRVLVTLVNDHMGAQSVATITTKKLRAVQLVFGHTNLDSAVRYLGIELEDASDVAEKFEV